MGEVLLYAKLEGFGDRVDTILNPSQVASLCLSPCRLADLVNPRFLELTS